MHTTTAITNSFAEACRIYGVSKDEVRKRHLHTPPVVQCARRYIACSLHWNHGMRGTAIAATLGLLNTRHVFKWLAEEAQIKFFIERKNFTL